MKPFHFFRVVWRKIRGCSGGGDFHGAIARREKSSEILLAFASTRLFALNGVKNLHSVAARGQLVGEGNVAAAHSHLL